MTAPRRVNIPRGRGVRGVGERGAGANGRRLATRESAVCTAGLGAGLLPGGIFAGLGKVGALGYLGHWVSASGKAWLGCNVMPAWQAGYCLDAWA